jgi:ATP-dependent RNA helicase DDX27
VKACSDLGFEHPTVIQRKAIPALVEGNDVLAHAVTGSGKTASYLLPILEKHMRYMKSLKGKAIAKTRFLILQPTRELAAQCASMLKNLCTHVQNFEYVTLIGGSSVALQRKELKAAPDCVIASPGRLIDHLANTQGFDLEDIDVLVLDEADKLLEMGFKDELLKVIDYCKSKTRQTIMVSATLNQDIKELANIALSKPLEFSVSQQQNTTSEANLKLKHYIVRLQTDSAEGAPEDVANQLLL